MKSIQFFGIIFCLIGIMFSANYSQSFAIEPEQEPEPPQIPEPAPEPFPGETESEKIERLTIENEKLKEENKNFQSQISDLNKKIKSLEDVIMEQIRVILDLTDRLKEIIFENVFALGNFI